MANQNIKIMLAKKNKVVHEEINDTKNFLFLLQRYGDPEELIAQFKKEYETNVELRNQENFMYASDEMNLDESDYDQSMSGLNHSVTSKNLAGGKKLKIRYLKNKNGAKSHSQNKKNRPSKLEIFEQAFEKGVTVDERSYGCLQKFKQKLYEDKKHREV